MIFLNVCYHFICSAAKEVKIKEKEVLKEEREMEKKQKRLEKDDEKKRLQQVSNI